MIKDLGLGGHAADNLYIFGGYGYMISVLEHCWIVYTGVLYFWDGIGKRRVVSVIWM